MKKYLTLVFASLLIVSFGFSGQVFAEQSNVVTISSVSSLLSNLGYISAVGKENVIVAGIAPSGSIVTIVLSDNSYPRNSISGTQTLSSSATSYSVGLNSMLAYPEALHDGLINVSVYMALGSNSAQLSATTTIIKETIAPTITILGDNPFKCHLRAECPDLGAMAFDSFGNKLDVTVSNNVRINTEGSYTIRYSAVDFAGNEADIVTRRVTVSTSNTVSTTTAIIPDAIKALIASSSLVSIGNTVQNQPVILTTPSTEIVTNPVQTITIQVSGIVDTIKRSLVLGTRGNDVRLLQTLLAKDSVIYPEGLITSYFGNLTKNAVQRFQEKYNIASKGISGYGLFGPKTKAKMIELYGN
ncbi:MAG: immunoglobulin-like domain-containing protein [Candidatus Paceibacterota bacterium]|jgi:hypothetical protein